MLGPARRSNSFISRSIGLWVRRQAQLSHRMSSARTFIRLLSRKLDGSTLTAACRTAMISAWFSRLTLICNCFERVAFQSAQGIAMKKVCAGPLFRYKVFVVDMSQHSYPYSWWHHCRMVIVKRCRWVSIFFEVAGLFICFCWFVRFTLMFLSE